MLSCGCLFGIKGRSVGTWAKILLTYVLPGDFCHVWYHSCRICLLYLFAVLRQLLDWFAARGCSFSGQCVGQNSVSCWE